MTLLRSLKPADVLLYKPRGLFGWIIRLKTWHPIAHVEGYVGDGFSVASRDGIGVGTYSCRTDDLALVCRPILPFNLALAMKWHERQKGTPYGWADLLQFAGLDVDADGIVCSPYITRFLRAGNLDPFNGEPAEKIAPFQFELSPVFEIYEVKNGRVTPRGVLVAAQAP